MTYDPSNGSTGMTPSTTSDDPSRAEQVATSAKQQGRQTAEVAGEELRNVASEVSSQARDLFGELRTQVGEQTSTQKQRLTEALRTFTDELQEMAKSGGGSGVATELVRRIAARAESLHSQLDRHEPSDLLDQGRSAARQRPGSFLLGALAAGAVAGRLTRGSKTDVSEAPDSSPRPTAAPASPAIDLTTGYGEPVFEPSPYETGHAGTTPGVPTSPTGQPYSGGGLQ